MDTAQARTVEQAAQRSTLSTKAYIENPKSREAKLKALSDANRLATELQDGDDMIFTRLEQVNTSNAFFIINSFSQRASGCSSICTSLREINRRF